ncbi:hypothetical protein IAT38_001241 [Cryptococcus sp. DSM 104549]
MEISTPTWTRQAASLDRLVVKYTAGKATTKLLGLAKVATTTANEQFEMKEQYLPSLLAETGRIFLHGDLSHKESRICSIMMNHNDPLVLLDLARVPRRQAALAYERTAFTTKNTNPVPQRIIFNPEVSFIPWSWCTGTWHTPVVSSLQRPEDLEMVGFKDLACPSRHTGRKVVGRVIGQCMLSIGVTFQIEDPSGFVLPVSLLFPTPILEHSLKHKTAAKDRLYPVDTVVLIKEPCVRIGENGGYILAVDVATDIMELPSVSPLLEGVSWSRPLTGRAANYSWEDYKALGNKEMNEDHPVIAANLVIGMYGAAYLDASQARKLADNSSFPVTAMQRVRMIWRLANALYGLRMYDKTAQIAEEHKDNADLTNKPPYLVHKLAMRLKERAEGRYAWEMMLQALSLFPASPSIDVAEYSAPVEVRPTPDGSHGLFVKHAVRRGQLLMVAKPLVKCWASEFSKRALSILDPEAEELVEHETFNLVERLAGMVVDNPSLMRVLGGLPTHKDPRPANLADVVPFPDDERLQMIENAAPYAVNKERLRRIVEKNTVPLQLAESSDSTKHHGSEELGVKIGRAVFGLPMVAKEVCWGGNFTCYCFGDVMVCRATQDLPAGTELLRSSMPNKIPDRTTNLDALLRTCDCKLCEADKADDWRGRAALVAEAGRARSSGSYRQKEANSYCQKEAKMRAIVSRMARTYGEREPWMKPELAELWVEIACYSDRRLLAEGQVAGAEHFDDHGSREQLDGWKRSQCWMNHLFYGGGLDLYKLQSQAYLDNDPVDWEGFEEEWWHDP